MKLIRVGSQPCDLFPPHPLFFASDLHLGDGSAADDFAEGSHRAAFEWFLERKVEPDGGDLILLGDVFELWQAKLKDIRDHQAPLFWRLHNYRLIRGNHDAAYKKPPEWRWPSGSRPQLLAEHGHQADPLNSNLGFIGRVVTAVAGVLERLGWRDIDAKTWRWKWLPTPVTRPSRFRPYHYEAYALERMRETGAEVVVLGHTHKPSLTPFGGMKRRRLYANCGCWVSDDYDGSWVKVHDGRVSVWKMRCAST